MAQKVKMSNEHETDRAVAFRKLIRLDEAEGSISLADLQKYLLLPFPDDQPGLRFYNWQLSLRVLPPQRELWDTTWKTRTMQYGRLVKHIFRNVPDFLDSGLQPGRLIECPKMMQEIHRDVVRLPKISQELVALPGIAISGESSASSSFLVSLARSASTRKGSMSSPRLSISWCLRAHPRSGSVLISQRRLPSFYSSTF
jgi:hypothetical protein